MFVVPCRVSLGYFHANVSAWLSINKGGHSEYAHGQCLIHATTLGYQTDNPSMLRKQECQQSYSPNNVNLCSLVKAVNITQFAILLLTAYWPWRFSDNKFIHFSAEPQKFLALYFLLWNKNWQALKLPHFQRYVILKNLYVLYRVYIVHI